MDYRKMCPSPLNFWHHSYVLPNKCPRTSCSRLPFPSFKTVELTASEVIKLRACDRKK